MTIWGHVLELARILAWPAVATVVALTIWSRRTRTSPTPPRTDKVESLRSLDNEYRKKP